MSNLESIIPDSLNTQKRLISMNQSKLNTESSELNTGSSSLRNTSNVCKCVTINGQYKNLIHGFHSKPFEVKIFEDVITIPGMGEFKRYLYQLKTKEKILDEFHSLEMLNDEFIMEEPFADSVEMWMRNSLNIK